MFGKIDAALISEENGQYIKKSPQQKKAEKKQRKAEEAAWVARSGPVIRDEDGAEHALLRSIHRVTGTIPVGTKDVLQVLAHPDVIAHTKNYILDREASDED